MSLHPKRDGGNPTSRHSDNRDLKTIKSEILGRINISAEYTNLGVEFTSNKEDGKGWRTCRAFGREDRDPSAGVNIQTGVYKSFGDGAETLSFFDFVLKYGNLGGFSEVLAYYQAKVGIPSSIIPEPTKASKPKTSPKRSNFHASFDAAVAWASQTKAIDGSAVGTWVYFQADGEEALRVVRFSTKNGTAKSYRPFHIDPEARGWVCGDPDGLLPLYNLLRLVADPAGTVWLAEGEKCSDIVTKLGLTATTSAHGAQAAAKTDWSPLAGRDIVILPDHGEAGSDYRTKVLEILQALDPRPTVRVVDLPGLAEGDDVEQWLASLPDSWDDVQAKEEMERLASGTTAYEFKSTQVEAANETTSEDDPYANATDQELGIIDATEIELENPEWLWARRFLVGKINLLVGEGGGGKTTIAIMIASVVTRGGEFPDGSPSGNPGRILVLAAEDGAGDTILPRFVAAGADLSFGMVKIMTARVCIPKKGNRPAMVNPVSLLDLPYWEKVFETLRPRVLLIDPLPAYMGRGVNDNKNSDVQNALVSFAAIANKFGVCIIAITHTGKATDRKLIHKVLGSVAYTNTARIVHIVVSDPDDPGVRYLHRDKCNLDEPVNALCYKIASSEFERDGKNYKTSRVVFERDSVAIDAEAMANPKRDGGPTKGPDPKREIAVAEWLYDFLDGQPGWTEQRAIIAAAGEAGLIGKKNEVSQKWSNLTLLYRAKDKQLAKLSEPRSGRRIEEADMRLDRDRYPRICWRLVHATDPF